MAHRVSPGQYCDDPQLASHVMHDYVNADLDLETRGMFDFAVKLTHDPSSMSEADVETTKGLGLSDERILSVVLITCLFNFMTRLADGLGVEVQEGRQEAIESWLTGPTVDQEWLMQAKD